MSFTTCRNEPSSTMLLTMMFGAPVAPLATCTLRATRTCRTPRPSSKAALWRRPPVRHVQVTSNVIARSDNAPDPYACICSSWVSEDDLFPRSSFGVAFATRYGRHCTPCCGPLRFSRFSAVKNMGKPGRRRANLHRNHPKRS